MVCIHMVDGLMLLFAEIEKVGYTAPTAIQAQTIPLALSGYDIIGLAKTGEYVHGYSIYHDAVGVVYMCWTRCVCSYFSNFIVLS